MYRPIDTFMLQVKDKVDYINQKIVDSIVLTVHNQEGIIKKILSGIEENTEGSYELIIILDGCTDNSEKDVIEYVNNSSLKDKTIIKYTNNIFENKAITLHLSNALESMLQ